MSGQAGIFYRDGRPIAPELLASIEHSLDPFGGDHAGKYVQPGLAMVYRALHITPADPMERQPFVSRQANVMTWDGRLDNREELLFRFGRDLQDDTTDVALAMAVYEKCGADGFANLIGDWSLVVFDSHAQVLVMASDYMGVRPLYFCEQPDSVTWSTTLECLVTLHGLQEDISTDFIVGYITGAKRPGVTPYRRVRAVLAAHSVTFPRTGAMRAQQFWDFTSNTIRYQRDADYDVHLRSLFMEAVGSRLRSSAPVWAQLSGGLDSSSIVCAADALIKQSLVAAPSLSTVGYVTDGSPESDERRFMTCVDQHIGQRTHYLQLDGSEDRLHREHRWITPEQPPGIAVQTYELVRRTNCRLLLTGFGGDTVMGNCLDYHYDVAQLLQRSQFLAAVQLGRQRARAAQRPIAGVLHEAYQELRPRLLLRNVLSQQLAYAGGTPPATDSHVADLFLLKPSFVALWHEEWTRHIARVLTFPNVSQRRQASELMRVSDMRQAQSPSEEPLACVSHPYLHRPLVDFMLSIPVGVVAPPGQTRGLMRRAFAPFVPQRIIARFSKGYASPFLIRKSREVLANWLGRLSDLRIARLECIDEQRLGRYLESVRDGSSKNAELLGTLVTLEEWLEMRECRSRRALVYSSVEGR